MTRLKLLAGYSIEIIIGAMLLIFPDDIRWFLFYLLIVILIVTGLLTDYLRKINRVYQALNEAKLLAIIRKLKITDEELTKASDEIEQKLTDKQRESLLKDLNDLNV